MLILVRSLGGRARIEEAGETCQMDIDDLFKENGWRIEVGEKRRERGGAYGKATQMTLVVSVITSEVGLKVCLFLKYIRIGLFHRSWILFML